MCPLSWAGLAEVWQPLALWAATTMPPRQQLSAPWLLPGMLRCACTVPATERAVGTAGGACCRHRRWRVRLACLPTSLNAAAPLVWRGDDDDASILEYTLAALKLGLQTAHSNGTTRSSDDTLFKSN
jgi:hypothetical protein